LKNSKYAIGGEFVKEVKTTDVLVSRLVDEVEMTEADKLRLQTKSNLQFGNLNLYAELFTLNILL